MSNPQALASPGHSEDLAAESGRKSAVARLKVNVDRLHTSYANVVTTNANRDEVALAFGLKTPGDPGQGVEVRLHTRIVMNPFAAKRLLERLNRLQDAAVQPTAITL
jgi:hypothetical protein